MEVAKREMEAAKRGREEQHREGKRRNGVGKGHTDLPEGPQRGRNSVVQNRFGIDVP